ncbi:MAG: ABC transporter permease [Chloroflexi bacterium]|nr:ABC transporter permease [Chloroflexota bacterium]
MRLSAILAIAYRDLLKLLRDPLRIVLSLIFPMIFIGALGPISGPQLLGLTIVAIAVCLFGGSFGVLVLANLNSQRAANQVIPFIIWPQFFLAGVFTPIQVLPWYLDLLSKLSPMRYAIDLARGVFYAGQPDYAKVVLRGVPFNLLVIAVLFILFLVAGTWLFVRGERNR